MPHKNESERDVDIHVNDPYSNEKILILISKIQKSSRLFDRWKADVIIYTIILSWKENVFRYFP